MTAWQDQPPQSRRQLRLSEQRDASGDGLSEQQHAELRLEDAGADAVQTPVAHLDSFTRPEWEAPARRSAAHEGQALSDQQPRSRAEAAIASGRRSQHAYPQAVAPAQEPQDSAQHSPYAPDTRAADLRMQEAQTQEAQTPDVQTPDPTRRSSQVPSYGGPSFGAGAPSQPVGPDVLRPRRGDDRPSEPQAPRVDDTPPAYRVREFSPESRRSVFSSTSELSPSEWGKPGAAGEPSDLDYRTQQRPAEQQQLAEQQRPDRQSGPEEARATAPQSVPQSFSELRSAQQPQSEHTLTRRELRALRQASEQDAGQDAEQPAEVEPAGIQPIKAQVVEPATARFPVAEPLVVEPSVTEPPVVVAPEVAQVPPPLRVPAAPAPQSSHELSRAMAEFDTLIAREPAVAVGVDVEVPAAASAAVFTPVPAHPVETAPAVPGEGNQTNSVWPNNVQQGMGAEDSRVDHRQPSRAVESDPDAGKVYTVPTGHWSTQGAIDDEIQPDGVTLSRNVAATGGAVTASHLVISSVPTANDLLLPFSATGEIMVTGTIDLPRSLGTTGAHPARYDHSDVDALLEASDREDSNVDSAPVRAIRAVSTHTSSRGLIGTAKPPRSSRLPMVLAISTAAVAAAVVVLFVAGFVLHLF